MSDSLQPHGLEHARLPCPSPILGACSNSSPSSQWCHPTILSSVGPFSSCRQSFPASGSFPMSQFFTLGGQSIGVSALASVLPMNTQDWSSEWTGWISLQCKGLSRVFSNTIVRKHQFFSFTSLLTCCFSLSIWSPGQSNVVIIHNVKKIKHYKTIKIKSEKCLLFQWTPQSNLFCLFWQSCLFWKLNS